MRCTSMPTWSAVHLAAWLAVVVILPHDAQAQTVEVTPFGGYRVGGGFFDVPAGRVVDDDAAPSVGLLVNVDVGLATPGLKFEGLFSREEVRVEIEEVRDGYREMLHQRMEYLAREANNRHANYAVVSTLFPYLEAIEAYLGFRGSNVFSAS